MTQQVMGQSAEDRMLAMLTSCLHAELRSGKSDREALKAAPIVAMIAVERSALERAAQAAEDRAPVVQCMSVEPVVTACLDIATAIRALGDS